MPKIDVDFAECELSSVQVGSLAAMVYAELAQRHACVRRRLRVCGGCRDLLSWGRHYLPDHFSRPASAMHRWLAHHLDRMPRDAGVKLNVLGPRGSAKSTLAALAFPLRAAVEAREPYIWIVSDTQDQARAHLENVKTELADNPRLAADYPEAVGRGRTWRRGGIVLGNGATIEAFGTGQAVRGRRRGARRPSLIICDDLQNDRHIHSRLARQRAREWFHGTLLKAGTPETNVVNLATALHRDALAMELARTPGWISRVFRSIPRWPVNETLWQAWGALYADPGNPRAVEDARAFYVRNRQAMHAGAVVLWPEAENLYALMCMRAESGTTAFAREKQNEPIDPDECEWPESYFDETVWFDQWPEHLQVKTLALDPSKGADARRGDFSALVALGVDRQGILHFEADLARRGTPEMVAAGVEFYRRFRPDAFGVEANQFQELLAGQFHDAFRRRDLLGVHPWMIDNHVHKHVRIRRLGPYLAQGRVRFKSDSPSTRLLVEQLREFPLADHDDGPDAAEMALRLALEITRLPIDDGLGQRLAVG
ncbi:MAG: hypothetical protein JW809_06770 [Pirellulales bacterium]|nr:hypothetical protein [Pirellulales bacterium]